MGLSQAELDMVAQEVKLMYGSVMELVAYSWRATKTATPVVYADIPLHFSGYRQHALTTEAIAPDDQKARVATADMPVTPTINDTLVRSDGTEWKVVGPPEGGPGHPFWFLQCRR